MNLTWKKPNKKVSDTRMKENDIPGMEEPDTSNQPDMKGQENRYS